MSKNWDKQGCLVPLPAPALQPGGRGRLVPGASVAGGGVADHPPPS